ncbi:Oxygen-independent coproporphyrinogen-III oxidase 1 [Roseivivax jejudonensis]|uniref:Heme chaperone HemW n=1 Tax=Roseivivax jejudonensis TaxID=1529041 RepID=A0A1X6ZN29_9RHOB|nr:radical SAM family heme chaperone HemW [Roseivivax jejudonensis]SLN56048.1 Oxygen-independent coproporphyrinogen-III oxidase 1 [Roseivivax jejudonensis]
MAEDWHAGGFGLYLHWPFCEAKCPYCDFNSHVSREIDEARWGAAFEAEIARTARRTGPRQLDTIFFGGGTPSLMSPDLVARILDATRRAWTLAPDAEITLEANPRSVEAGRFRGYAEAGVNRLSMGLQALNDRDLHRLGRLHSVAEARAAYDTARAVFPRVSFDLIYARQDQSVPDWERELNEALAMAVDHLSLYQLTLEQGTAFWDRARRGTLPGLPDEDLSADMYERTQEICDAAGRPAYEVSNHAVPGGESRHNLVYWRGGDYAGIGPGAHGRLTLDGTRRAVAAWRNPGAWLEHVEDGTGDRVDDPLSPQDHVGEYIMMGMRVLDGIDVDRARAIAPELDLTARSRDLQDLGLVTQTGSRLSATPQGRLVLNGVIAELLP